MFLWHGVLTLLIIYCKTMKTTKRFFSILLMGAATVALNAANPYLPLWEYIPDGEPYVFEDPDNPGKYRVYVYGSHDHNIV